MFGFERRLFELFEVRAEFDNRYTRRGEAGRRRLGTKPRHERVAPIIHDEVSADVTAERSDRNPANIARRRVELKEHVTEIAERVHVAIAGADSNERFRRREKMFPLERHETHPPEVAAPARKLRAIFVLALFVH